MEKKFIPLLLVLVLCIGLFTPASAADSPAPKPTFADVPTSHWAYEDIASMAAQKVVNGVGNDRFDPEAPVKCAEFTTMVTRLLFTDELSKQSSAADWWTPGLEVLRQLGILDGTSLLPFYT